MGGTKQGVVSTYPSTISMQCQLCQLSNIAITAIGCGHLKVNQDMIEIAKLVRAKKILKSSILSFFIVFHFGRDITIFRFSLLSILWKIFLFEVIITTIPTSSVVNRVEYYSQGLLPVKWPILSFQTDSTLSVSGFLFRSPKVPFLVPQKLPHKHIFNN